MAPQQHPWHFSQHIEIPPDSPSQRRSKVSHTDTLPHYGSKVVRARGKRKTKQKTIKKLNTRDDTKENLPRNQHEKGFAEDIFSRSCCLSVPSACLARGEAFYDGWWLKQRSDEVLGDLKETMQSLAKQCLEAVQAPYTRVLRVLSLSDGCVNDQHNRVPTSVLLAYAFANLDSLPFGLERVMIFGGDAYNPGPDEKLYCEYSFPPWLKLQHVRLDNLLDFKPQLSEFLEGDQQKFDVILMRQGLCYCRDHSFECVPPEKLEVVGVKGEDKCFGGEYVLEPNPCNSRPAYRNGKYLMRWRPNSQDWIIEEDAEEHYVWANVVKDCGSPALANAHWFVWDGTDFVIDWDIACVVLDPSLPWRQPPNHCTCCGGIALNAAGLESFMERVAAVLDEHQPKAFAFLHSGFYMGTLDEVEELLLELDNATELFNSGSPAILATVLKAKPQEWEIPHWNRIDGVMLSTNRPLAMHSP